MVRNFGHDLDGLVTVVIDQASSTAATSTCWSGRRARGIELIGHHEILLPLLHAAVACKLAAVAEPALHGAAA